MSAFIPIKPFFVLLTFTLGSAVSRAEEKLDLTYPKFLTEVLEGL